MLFSMYVITLITVSLLFAQAIVVILAIVFKRPIVNWYIKQTVEIMPIMIKAMQEYNLSDDEEVAEE